MSGLAANQATAASHGVSVDGPEAREVYNTLVALGATRVSSPEGPTVIVDKVDCLQANADAGRIVAKCKFVGDPKLNLTEGDLALRLVKALLGVGMKQKVVDAKTFAVGVTQLECGVLHSAAPGADPSAETASCYLVDNN